MSCFHKLCKILVLAHYRLLLILLMSNWKVGLSFLQLHKNWTFVNSSSILKDIDVTSILTIILELGFVDVRKHFVVLPLSSAWNEDRMTPFLQYMSDYVVQHPDHFFSCYFTLFDGWREHTEPKDHPLYLKLPLEAIHNDFVDHSSNIIQQGRFISADPYCNIFPILNESVCSFGRHKGDISVILIPDSEFIQSYGYINLKKVIDLRDIPWKQKKAKLIWRGRDHGIGYRLYNTNKWPLLLSQRRLSLTNFFNTSNMDINIGGQTTKKYMLTFKFQLDIDGEVNAWSSLWVRVGIHHNLANLLKFPDFFFTYELQFFYYFRDFE